MSKERVEKARLCYDWILYDEAVELGIINYYEGCEKQVEEEMDRVSDALESALEVFSQLLGMEKEDGFDLMLDLLAPIYEEVEEVKDKEEVETTENKEDKNELSEVLGEILDKAMDEDEENDSEEDEVPTHVVITLKDEAMEEVKEGTMPVFLAFKYLGRQNDFLFTSCRFGQLYFLISYQFQHISAIIIIRSRLCHFCSTFPAPSHWSGTHPC